MAGRIRSIKPEFLEDSKLAHMCAVDRLLFASTWLIADDYGNLGGDPDWIHGQVFWGDSLVTRDNVRESLARLSSAGMLLPYAVREQPYFHVTNWHRHQKVDKPGKPRVPGPECAEISEQTHDSRESRESRDNVRESLAPDQDQDQDHVYGERASTHTHPTPARAPRPDPFAASFRSPDQEQDKQALALFEVWKRESGKSGAQWDAKRKELFQRLLLDGVTEEQVVLVVRGAKKSEWAMKARLSPSAILGSAEKREEFTELAKAKEEKKETHGWMG